MVRPRQARPCTEGSAGGLPLFSHAALSFRLMSLINNKTLWASRVCSGLQGAYRRAEGYFRGDDLPAAACHCIGAALSTLRSHALLDICPLMYKYYRSRPSLVGPRSDQQGQGCTVSTAVPTSSHHQHHTTAGSPIRGVGLGDRWLAGTNDACARRDGKRQHLDNADQRGIKARPDI